MTSLRMARSDPLAGTRGRPRAPWLSISDIQSFNYLARTSSKNEIEVSKLLECIRDAWVQKESSFNNIRIRLRQMVDQQGFFLITQDDRVLAQVKLTLPFLKYLAEIDIRSLSFERNPMIKNRITRALPKDLMIKDLDSQTNRFNIEVKVTEKSAPRMVFSRWGGEFLLSTATVTDRSGAIKLPLWNKQTSEISVGDLLHIENAQLKKFRGEFQIRIGKSSTMRIVEK